MPTKKKTIVNPTFRLDVTGKLFLNKDSNLDVQDTIIFNNLMTRLSIEKGYLPTFPDLGLKQHLYNFNFIEDDNVDIAITNFESDVSFQMGQACNIEFNKDPDNRNIVMTFSLEKLKYNIKYEYSNVNGSIRVINYSFVD